MQVQGSAKSQDKKNKIKRKQNGRIQWRHDLLKMTRDSLNEKMTWKQELKETKEQATQIPGGGRFKEEVNAHEKAEG